MDKNTDSVSYTDKILSENPKLDSLLDSLNLDKHNLSVPISVFSNRDLSALENIVHFLKSKGLPNNMISKYLNRDEHTVSSVITRINSKLSTKNNSKNLPQKTHSK